MAEKKLNEKQLEEIELRIQVDKRQLEIFDLQEQSIKLLIKLNEQQIKLTEQQVELNKKNIFVQMGEMVQNQLPELQKQMEEAKKKKMPEGFTT